MTSTYRCFSFASSSNLLCSSSLSFNNSISSSCLAFSSAIFFFRSSPESRRVAVILKSSILPFFLPGLPPFLPPFFTFEGEKASRINNVSHCFFTVLCIAFLLLCLLLCSLIVYCFLLRCVSWLFVLSCCVLKQMNGKNFRRFIFFKIPCLPCSTLTQTPTALQQVC